LKTHRQITLLGSTGSIGTSTLEVLHHLNDRFSVSGLSTNGNIGLLEEQVFRFNPPAVAVLDTGKAELLRRRIGSRTEVLAGEEGLLDLATREEPDVLLNALVGFAGLRPTLSAIRAGKDIALANKETLVVAGDLVIKEAAEHRVRLLPIDSEHSAILQCLQGEDRKSVSKLVITASGGPFLDYDAERLETVTVRDALNHPTWKMGTKITVDSATLMNKGLEVIEASRLFGVPPERIEVLVHPQSIVHSLVEFDDGSVKAQLGVPDMRLPIQYALTYPDRPRSDFRRIDFQTFTELTFRQPDRELFPCLDLAYQALRMGGTAPAVLNAANEIAVQLFLEERIPFTAISRVVATMLEQHDVLKNATLDDIMTVDRETREGAFIMAVSAYSRGPVLETKRAAL